MTRRVEVAAPAKINLSLRVLGQREDGYHEIDTLFQAVDLADDVTVEADGAGVELDVHGVDLGPAHANLAYRAAALAREAVGVRHGLRVGLTKRIPVGAGLGGGSSDAAAVLVAVAALAGLERRDERLQRVAEALGSDVAFFLGDAPLARGTGRGEVLEILSPLPSADLVLVSPPVHVSSGAAYRWLDDARRERVVPGPVGDRGKGVASAAPRTWRDVARTAHNDFEAVVARRHSQVGRALTALREAGADLAMMTGSGSTSFGLFDSRVGAEHAAVELERDLGWPCRAVRTLDSWPSPRGR